MNHKIKFFIKLLGALALAIAILIASFNISRRPNWEHLGNNVYLNVNSSIKKEGFSTITIRTGDSWETNMRFDCGRRVYFEKNGDAVEVQNGTIADRIMQDACAPRWYDFITNLF